MPQERESVLCTTSAVAKMFGVDDSTVRRWVATGKLVAAVTTPGGHMRFAQDEVDRLLGRAG